MEITPAVLKGTVDIPSSKSEAHRAIICASFAPGSSVISNVTMSQDIEATINGLRNLGADIEIVKSDSAANQAIVKVGRFKIKQNENIVIDCGESGSTLRFLIPIAASLYGKVRFTGRGRLAKRPLDVYFDIFRKQGIRYSHGSDFLPLDIEGRLDSEEYEVRGDISSQFVTGLMLAAGIGSKRCEIAITGTLQSKPYIDITQDMMSKFGANAEYDKKHNKYIIKGGGYKTSDFKVMGDWSHAGFFLLAGSRSRIAIKGLGKNSMQGDKTIVDILKSMGADIYWDDDVLVSRKAQLHGETVDVSQCPDLAPVIGAAMAIAQGESRIIGGERLKIKESDRIQSVVNTICNLGGTAQATDDGMIINGAVNLSGGNVSCYNDHRIAMMTGALSVYCEGEISVEGHECVAKSYPAFWDDFAKLGGKYEQHVG